MERHRLGPEAACASAGGRHGRERPDPCTTGLWDLQRNRGCGEGASQASRRARDRGGFPRMVSLQLRSCLEVVEVVEDKASSSARQQQVTKVWSGGLKGRGQQEQGGQAGADLMGRASPPHRGAQRGL